MSQTSWTIKHFDRLPSTQDRIKEFVAEGEDQGHLAVIADIQDNGRGRHGNQWVSYKGNLLTTLHLKTDGITGERAGHYAFIAAVALIDALKELVDVNIRAKWPNDILINGKKVAGILLESELSGKLVENLYIGMGVNISQSPEYATQLDEYTKDVIEPQNLLNQILKKTDQYIDLYKDNGFKKIREQWLQHGYGLGQNINVRYSDRTLQGVFKDIDAQGALLLELESGAVQRITAGEVHFE